jgi:hypothetical protein
MPNKLHLPDIFGQMVQEVEEWHRHGCIHHDIRPGNYRIMGNRVVLGYLSTDGRQTVLWRQRFSSDTQPNEHVEALQGW